MGKRCLPWLPEDHSPRQASFKTRIWGFSHCHDTHVKTHCCGSILAAPLFDRLRRSTVGSGTREDVKTAYEMTVLPEVVYIAPVPRRVRNAISCRIAAPATSHQHLLCLQRFRLWVDEVSLGSRAERRAAR